MNPIRAKDLLPDLIKDTTISLELVENLTEYFWDYIHKSMTSLEHYHILIPHIGTFHIKGSIKLGEAIAKLEKSVINYRSKPPKTQKLYAIYLQKEQMLLKLKKLLEQYNQESNERKSNRELRKSIREAKDNLASQTADPGGSSEFPVYQGISGTGSSVETGDLPEQPVLPL